MNTLHRCRGAATVATTALLPGTHEVWDDSDVEGLLSVLFHNLKQFGSFRQNGYGARLSSCGRANTTIARRRRGALTGPCTKRR